MTLGHIGVDDSMIRLNGVMVQAFAGTKASAYEEIDLKVIIDLCKFEISFIVVDISTVFNLVFGRPLNTRAEPPGLLYSRKLNSYPAASSSL